MDVEDVRRLDNIEYRLGSLERWRKMHVDPCIERVAEMERADEIAAAVASQLHERDRFRLTRRQKAAASLYSIVLVLLPIAASYLPGHHG